LIATDFSKGADNAMEFTMHLAKVLGQEVVAMHAMGSMEGVDNNTYNALYIDDYRKSKQEALDAWASGFTGRFDGVTVSTHVEVGSVSSLIVKYAAENPIAIIVMGASGSTGISDLFGSTTSSVVLKTTVPVLIVPPGSTFSPDPTITLATDFSSGLSFEDVEALNELINAFGTKKLQVVNVVDKQEGSATGEAGLKKLIPGTELDFNYIEDSNTVEGIFGYINKSQTDILCVVKHHHNVVYRIFNRSTVNKVLNRAITAVLVLHE
jgi:nucleotide-binding universal stress UspA family protein